MSYDTTAEKAREACHWWAALALTQDEKAGVEDPREMERLADAAADRAHTRFIVSADPDEMVEAIAAYLRPRIHRTGLPWPAPRPAHLP